LFERRRVTCRQS